LKPIYYTTVPLTLTCPFDFEGLEEDKSSSFCKHYKDKLYSVIARYAFHNHSC